MNREKGIKNGRDGAGEEYSTRAVWQSDTLAVLQSATFRPDPPAVTVQLQNRTIAEPANVQNLPIPELFNCGTFRLHVCLFAHPRFQRI